VCGEVDRCVVMRSPCAGAAVDPPLWIVPNQALSLSVSLRVSLSKAHVRSSVQVFVYVCYCSTYYKAVRVCVGGNNIGHVLRETTSRVLCGQVLPSRTSERGGEGYCVKEGG
jgi:hypothetical protein